MKVGVRSTVQTALDGNVKALLILTSVEIVIGQVLIVLKKTDLAKCIHLVNVWLYSLKTSG